MRPLRRSEVLPLRAGDVRAWRRLVSRLERALSDHRPATSETLANISAAAALARKARLPFPPYSWENPFAQLVELARPLETASPLEAAIAFDALRPAFDACLAQWPDMLTAPPAIHMRPRPVSPSWLQRKDIGCDDY